MRIAVIGASGYIGSKLATFLEDRGHLVKRYGRGDVESEIEESEVVIFLGGINDRIRCQIASPEVLHEENVAAPIRILERLPKDTLFIYASTLKIIEGGVEADESFEAQEDLLDPYTSSMLARERAIQNNTSLCTRIGLRLGTVIGISEKQRCDLYIAMIKTGFLKGYIPIQHPNCRRAIVGLEDLCNVVHTIATKTPRVSTKRHEIYHVAGFNSSVQKVAANIACATKFPIRYMNTEEGPVGFSSSGQKLRDHYGIEFTETSQTLIQTILSSLGEIIQYKDPNIMFWHCCVCNSEKLTQVLDLGKQCLANSYRDRLEDKLEKYPLQLMRCSECSHMQLSHIVSREELFMDYIYASGTNATIQEYFAWFADFCMMDHGSSDRALKVLEIACNDGSQLDKFRDLGCETYGVDPAANIMAETIAKGHHSHVGFWGKDTFDLPEMDIMIAQNVLAHVDDPRAFMKACAEKMSAKTTLYVQTSQCDLIQNGEFDSIYHEHVSFFTVRSMRTLVEQYGLSLVNVYKTDIHGRSYIFKVAQKDSVITDLEVEEEQIGLYTPSFYYTYHQRVHAKILFLRQQLKALQDAGYTIIGYGAAAKGMTLLGALDLKAHGIQMKYIVDDADLKKNKYTPVDIPVKHSSALREEQGPFCLFLLAWNFKEEILKRVCDMHPFYYVVPFPEPTVFYSDRQLLRLQNRECAYFMKDRPEVNLVTHIFNEELLLPYYIHHYAHMIDHAVVLDYASTDRSREIVYRNAPDQWVVQESRNALFDALDVDEEVIDCERKFEPSSWKMTPTITEYFMCPNMFTALTKHKDAGHHGIMSPLYAPNGKDEIPFEPLYPLAIQRSQIIDPQLFVFNSHGMHRTYMSHNYYGPGRHDICVENVVQDFYYLKFKFTPWPDSLDRQDQMKSKLAQLRNGFGAHHYYSREQIIGEINEKRSMPSFAFDVVSSHDSEKKIETRHLWYNHMFYMGEIKIKYV